MSNDDSKPYHAQLDEYMKTNSITNPRMEKLTNGVVKIGSVSKYRSGKTKAIPKEKQLVLYEVTKLECFNPESGVIPFPHQNIGEHIANLRKKGELPPRKQPKRKDSLTERIKGHSSNNPQGRVEEVANSFYNLVDALDYFKDCPEKDREKLLKRLSQKDIGYLNEFLSAVWQKSEFKAFILKTEYRPERKYG
ncbi:hypothetical protein ACFLZZ_03540 [Nanoarchaeota archaeon]